MTRVATTDLVVAHVLHVAARVAREDLAHAVATKVAIDIGTGEINQERRNIAKETIRVLSMYVPSISGTKGNAKSELNLNIDDYKSRQWRNTVKLEEGVQDHE